MMASPPPDTARAASPTWVTRAGRVARAWRWWAPAVLAYLVSNAIAWTAARHTDHDYLDPGVHERWDSGLYLAVARDGYELFPCAPGQWIDDGNLYWCGNSGWFPLYPALVRALHAVTGMEYPLLGWLVAELATIAIIAALAVALAHTRTTTPARAAAVLALAAVLPAGVYFHAIFPMSLTAAFMTIAVVYLQDRRWLLAGVFSALAAMSYPIGAVIAAAAVGSVAALLWRRELTPRQGLLALLASAAPAALGIGLVFALLRAWVGRWDAYLLIQAKYAPGMLGKDVSHNPLLNFDEILTSMPPVRVAASEAMLSRLEWAVHTELLAALGFVLLVVLAAGLAWSRRQATPLDIGLAVFAVAGYVAPLLAGAHISQYRSHTLLIPAVVVLRHLPVWVLGPLAALSLPLAYAMGTLFFPSLLI